MSLSLKESQEVYKKAVVESANKKYTSTPLDDPAVMAEVMEVAKAEYGDAVVKKIESDNSKNERKKRGLATIRSVDSEEDGDYIKYTSSKQSVDFDEFIKNIQDTSHLDLFDIMNNDLGLIGEEYGSFKKGLYYYQHSCKQETQPLKINNKTYIDNRFHQLVIGPAASGKSTIKNQIKSIVSGDGDEDVFEATSISHEEQLIGTVKYEGRGDKRKAVQIPGILKYKVVLNDECQKLLNEKTPKHAACQRIKRQAMDPYLKNPFNKKPTGTKKNDMLNYFSESRISDFAHEDKLEDPFFRTGSFRRYGIIKILKPDEKIKFDNITEFKLEDGKNKISYKDILEDYYSKKRNSVKFCQQNLDIISNFHKAVLFYLLNHKNQNAFRFGLLTRYSIRDYFCKNVLILAISKNEKVPSLKTTVAACSDTLLFIFESIKSINQLADMGISSDVWGGLGEEDAECLEYLLRRGATSPNKSKISIKQFWTLLGHLYGCKITQARAHFYRLKRGGFVNSKKVGQYDSVVWLTFIPRETLLDHGDYDGIKIWDKLIQSVGLKIDLLTLSKKGFADDKQFRKAQSDGTVGIMGCLQLYIVLCVGNKDKKNNIYIYIEPKTNNKPTPTLPTLPTKKQSTPTIKTEVQSVKTPKNRPTLSNQPPLTVKTVLTAPVNLETGKRPADVDTHYTEDRVASHIRPCDKKEVLTYIKKNKIKDVRIVLSKLLEKFGPGVLKLKKDGVI